MVLLIRSIQVVLRSRSRPRLLSLGEEVSQRFRVLPTDLDLYRHMNHARYLNYFEASRWELQIRTGFFKHGLKQGWIAPVVHIQVKYLRALKLFQSFEVRSRIVKMGSRTMEIYQELYSQDKLCTQSLVTVMIRKGRASVLTSEYLPLLGYFAEGIPLPENLVRWLGEKKSD